MKIGYLKIENLFDEAHLNRLESILRSFHKRWLVENAELYLKGAINSAYITNGQFLSVEERIVLLQLISSHQLSKAIEENFGEGFYFLNSQIFFDPKNKDQKNYWHRDIQYTGQSIHDQQKAIEGSDTQVIHLRLSLVDEPGLEFVKNSHNRWDTEEEFSVRMQNDGKVSSDFLENSDIVRLKKGDLLMFDANIIHRGLYGNDRFSFDILFCRPLPSIMKYRDASVLPSQDELSVMDIPEVFGP